MALGRLVQCCRFLLHEPKKGLFSGILRPGWIEGCAGAKRHLLTEDVIKLQDFQRKKLAVAYRVAGAKENYIKQFSQKLQKKELILRDELKLLLHLCQSKDDMVIARDAIYRYYSENKTVLYGEFRFGPLFMRLCYELGLEEMAADTIKDESIKGFFSDSTSFNIAIDMLFSKGAYENALEVLRTMRSHGVTFNKDTLMLACGTCYKLNTPESYRICRTLIEEAHSKEQFILRNAYCFAVALAIRQNDTDTAQTLYSYIFNTESKLCRNLKVLLLTISGEVEEAVSILSAATLQKSPSFVKKPEFCQEVVSLLQLRTENGPYMMRVEQIVSQLVQTGQVIQQTLDDVLCYTPPVKRKPVLVMQERRTISRRTLRPLQSTLLSE
ncbi:pentatricopeptide repeat-containing protein 2, mitochondrial isoform X2 [Sphaeramia orbicularis]|uniref:pentatricopeptide repeat-containing protein 2, mitochondrial isoform X2 n=1 Tax=Sphaeramia orbicularis TaxID=375764 RepID=UPI00118176A5|nr:pentatricopeptide repeat-containing protein 2, mitochondrial isoform X2 [Sphaeramia orbicularis]